MAGPPPPGRWSSLPAARPPAPPRRRILPYLAPALVVVLLWLFDAHELAVIVAILATAVTIATVASPAARRTVDRAASWVARIVGQVLTIVLLGGVQLLIFTPVALLARVMRVDPLDPVAREGGSRWLARGPTRELHDRPYADESYRRLATGGHAAVGSPRWIRAVVGGLALLVGADLALGSVLAWIGGDGNGADEGDAPTFGFDPLDQEALRTQPDAAELMAELTAAGLGNPDPFTGWRFDDDFTHESGLVNITGGARRTRASGLDGEPLHVWFFGGSTMYGSGQSDLATIPSAFVARADETGVPVDATNFGHPAYANWQQVQLLEVHLTEGTRPAPDVVVFYDGFNDLTLQTQFGVHDEPTHLFFGTPAARTGQERSAGEIVRDWWGDHSALALTAGRITDLFGDDEPEIRVADVDAAPIDTIDPAAAADAALAIHRRGVDHVVALGRAYGFTPVFFWQPYLYSRDPLTAAETELVDLPGYDTGVWRPMTDRIRARLGDPVIDLSDVFDGVEGPLYWDFVHTNERGAALVAEAMLEPVLLAGKSVS